MSSMDNGSSDIPTVDPYSLGAGALGSNTYGFTTGDSGLGGLDTTSLGGALMGPSAGMTGDGLGVGAGSMPTSDSLNGNYSFAMPNTSGNFDASKLAAGMSAGAKLANVGSTPQQAPLGRQGTIRLAAQNFRAPIADFAGASKGSQAGESLLKLLANYAPGAK